MKDLSEDVRFKGLKPADKKIYLASPTMHGEEQSYINEAFDTNWVTTAGSNLLAIEDELARFIGCKYTVALSSGTSALHLATKLAGVRLYGQAKADKGTLAGRKVFCSDVTFDASVNPVAYEDGEAVFIDTEYDTWNMDPEALEKAFELYPEVKLVVIAHLYGTPGKMEELREICDRHGALMIEDAAESLGAEYRVSRTGAYADLVGAKASVESGTSKTGCCADTVETQPDADGYVWLETGCLGDYGAISFNGNKIITGSSGGMFLTDSKEDADRVRKWSTQSREPAPWYQHEEIGYNYRMSNIIAGIVRGQMKHLSEHIDRKREIYETYKNAFEDLPVTMNPYETERAKPNFWLSCMLIDRDAMAGQTRGTGDYSYETEPGKTSPQEILDALACFGAEGRPIWKPMHMQPIYREHVFVTRAGVRADVGADIFNRGVCLPSDIKMTTEEQQLVIEVVRRCFG